MLRRTQSCALAFLQTKVLVAIHMLDITEIKIVKPAFPAIPKVLTI